MKKICVIGSFNIDMIAKGPKLPRVGETVFTETFDLFIGGGKGANQAIAAGKLGADVQMAGILGDRFFGEEYLQVLEKNGVKYDTVELLHGEYPGIAYVAVDERGDNMLFVYSGTNMKVTPAFLDRHWQKISSCDIFLFQQEIPREANLYTMKGLKTLGGKTLILDPAPAIDFSEEYLQLVDIMTPNDVELQMITGITTQHGDSEGYRTACESLHRRGVQTVIAKAGKDGAYLSRSGQFTHFPAYAVKVVDTTAAGDSFNAGLAFGLSIGKTLEESIILANGVAGLSTTAVGAQNAMPTMKQLAAFLFDQTGEHVMME